MGAHGAWPLQLKFAQGARLWTFFLEDLIKCVS